MNYNSQIFTEAAVSSPGLLIQLFHTLKKRYTNLIGEKIAQEPKAFFDFVNMKRKSSGYQTSMFKGDMNSSNPQEISNLYADHFNEVFCQSKTPSNVFYSKSPIIVSSLNLILEEISKAIKELN